MPVADVRDLFGAACTLIGDVMSFCTARSAASCNAVVLKVVIAADCRHDLLVLPVRLRRTKRTPRQTRRADASGVIAHRAVVAAVAAGIYVLARLRGGMLRLTIGARRPDPLGGAVNISGQDTSGCGLARRAAVGAVGRLDLEDPTSGRFTNTSGSRSVLTSVRGVRTRFIARDSPARADGLWHTGRAACFSGSRGRSRGDSIGGCRRPSLRRGSTDEHCRCKPPLAHRFAGFMVTLRWSCWGA